MAKLRRLLGRRQYQLVAAAVAVAIIAGGALVYVSTRPHRTGNPVLALNPFQGGGSPQGTDAGSSPLSKTGVTASPSPGHGRASPSPGSTHTSSPAANGGSSPSPGEGTSSPPPTSNAPPPPPGGGGPAVARAGINVEPSIRPTRYAGANPNGWWCVSPNCYGVANGTAYVDAEMPLVARLGVHTLRVEFPWALMEPNTHGVYDWSRSDYIVNAANRYGVHLQPIIVFVPSWEGAGFTTPPRASDFSSFVSAVVNRYRGSIHYWEMWNEPDLSTYFNGSEGQYVSQVLVPGFQAVRGADPSARVILGGPSYANTGWLNGIYSLGGGQAFDIMAFHDYASSGGQIIGDAGAVAGVLQQHGQGGKPVWLGEYGLQENTVQDSGQQALMTAVVTGSSAIAQAQWYNLRDDFSMTSPNTIYKSAYWGLVQSNDVTLKQGYATMQQLIQQGY